MLFHRIIAQASGNPILAALTETIASALYDRRRKTAERSLDLRDSAEMHREIYRAIKAHKPAEAQRLMEDHLRAAKEAQGMERPTEGRGTRRAPRTRPARAEARIGAD